MGAGIRRLREGVDDEAPVYYEGIPLRPAVRAAAWSLGVLMTVVGIWWMARDGAFLEPAGTVLGAAGVVLLILSWRFRFLEIIVGDRWLVVQCGPVRRRFGRRDVELGPERPAGSWRRLYGDREIQVRGFSHPTGITVPIRDAAELQGLTGHPDPPGPQQQLA
ncbi:MAG: hypothetical protein GXP47_07565 [Acidobacteria bacterium]|nr:hypothetical protein [Acidobacteriota bacterium]